MKEYSLNEQSFSKASSWCCFTKPVEKVEKNSFLQMHKFGASKKKEKEKERKMGNNPIFGLELCAILKRKLKNNIRQIYGQFFGSCGLPWILSFICRGSLWLNISHC